MKTSKIKYHLKSIFMTLFILGAPFYAQGQAVRQSEAGFSCVDGRCLASAQKSSLMRMCEQMKSKAAWAKDWECVNATLFDDGNDRGLVNDLREKEQNGNALTAKEKAILEAANKVGAISMCNSDSNKTDGINGTGFLVRHKGKLAVVTSAHYMVYSKSRVLNKICKNQKRAKNTFYYPNMSYAGIDNQFALKKYKLRYPPENLDIYINNKSARPNVDKNDFLIFYLDTNKNLANKEMPDGRIRGVLQASTQTEKRQNVSIMGFAPDIQNGVPLIYQTGCNGVREKGLLHHTCDTVEAMSGSALLSFENNQMRLSGVESFSGIAGNKQIDRKYTKEGNEILWNGGSHVSNILNP